MNNDLFFLRHIIDEVRFLKTHCKGIPKEKFLYDEVLRKAVQKSLENISVASHNLSPGLKSRYRMIDWILLSQMQIRMKTKFLSIDYDYIIVIVKHEMPRLEKAATMMIEAEFPGHMIKEKGGLKLP